MFFILFSVLLIAPAAVQEDERTPPTREEVEQALAALDSAFGSGDTEARVAAIAKAREVVDTEVVDRIAKALKDDEREVRKASIQALRWMELPNALRALHKSVKGNRLIEKDAELFAALLKAIGQHADPGSIRILAKEPFDGKGYQTVRARLLGLGRIRTKDSVDALIKIMKTSGARHVERHMEDFRLSLMVLTGTDQGPSAAEWRRWWAANEKDIEIAPELGRLPRPMLVRWVDYWGLERDYGRHERREDRGKD